MTSETKKRFRAIMPALLFAVLAAGAGLLSWGLSHFAVPMFQDTLPPHRATPVFWQTLYVRIHLLRYLAAFGGALAALAAVIPPARWKTRPLVLLVVALAALVRFATPEMALDSIVRPDAVHFGAVAKQLVTQGSLRVPTGPHLLPARTLPGASVLMGLTQWLAPASLTAGIGAVWLFSLLAAGLAYFLGWRLTGTRTGGLTAALLILLSPLHGHYTRQLMSDVPWGTLVLAATALLCANHPRAWKQLLAGLLLGLGLLFKSSHFLIMAAVLLAWILHVRGSPRRVLPLLLGGLLGTVPALLYNRFVLGGWMQTAYHTYWPGWASPSEAIGWKYLWSPPLIKGSLGNVPYYALSFLGLDPRPERMPMLLPLVLAVLLSLFLRKKSSTNDAPPRTPFAVIAGWSTLLYGGACLLYSFQDPRFFLPILPLWLVAAALPLSRWIERWTPAARHTVLGLALLAVACTGLAILRVETSGLRVPERVLLERVARACKPYDVLVSDEDPVLLTEFGAWTPHTHLVPLLLEGELWFSEDPEKLFQETKAVVAPYAGTLSAVRHALDRGARIAVWIRKPHYRPEAYEQFDRAFERRAVPGTGVPGFEELVAPAPAELIAPPEPAGEPTAKLPPRDEPTDTLPNAEQEPQVLLRGGSFFLGGQGPPDAVGQNRSLPVQRVEVSPFFLSATEVDNASFASFINDLWVAGELAIEPDDQGLQILLATNQLPLLRVPADTHQTHLVWNPAESNAPCQVRPCGELQPERHPVSHVTWHGAALYCNWLSQQEGFLPAYDLAQASWPLIPGANGYRLPTEAQWELAASWDGQNKRMFAYGDDWDPLKANVMEASVLLEPPCGPPTLPVRTPSADAQALHHMTGNVWEWCQDWYSDYPKETALNPSGPATGTVKVVRGGSYRSRQESAWCAFRGILEPGWSQADIGFRTARPAQ